MAVHSLKCWPDYFEAIMSGKKSFDVRKDDREPRYEVGDILILEEFRAHVGEFTGRKMKCHIKRVARYTSDLNNLEGEGVREGYCIIGLGACELVQP